MTPNVTVVWDPRFVEYDFGPNHPWQSRARASGVSLLVASLEDQGQSPAIRAVDHVSPATRAELGQFHTHEFLDLVDRMDRHGRGQPLDRGDTPSFPGCFSAAARVVGGTLRAVESTHFGPPRAFQPAGGLHHAHADAASGFCIFNDLAVAIAQELGGRSTPRVAYIDIDAHHGDGVMDGFYEDGRVLDIDFHQDGRTLFPGTGFITDTGRGDGAGHKVNLPLPPGSGDETLIPLFERVVPPMLQEFHPDLIILQSGIDGHAGDPLAQLRYSDAAYTTVTHHLLELAERHGHGRILVTGGGGYLAENVARVLARVGGQLANVDIPAPEGMPFPARWREDFERTFGRPAPVQWSRERTAQPRGVAKQTVDRLLAGLSDALGRRFPPAARDEAPARDGDDGFGL